MGSYSITFVFDRRFVQTGNPQLTSYGRPKRCLALQRPISVRYRLVKKFRAGIRLAAALAKIPKVGGSDLWLVDPADRLGTRRRSRCHKNSLRIDGEP